MTLSHRWLRLAFLVLMYAAIWGVPASEAKAATSCTATMSALNFGSVDLVAGVNLETTALLEYTCTNSDDDDTAYTRVCFNLGNGSAGQAAQPGGAFDPRLLSNGTDLMQVRFYQPDGQVWGSTSQVVSNAYDVRVGPIPRRSGSNYGSASGQALLRAVISGGQSSLSAGSYTSSFIGNHTNVRSTPAVTRANAVPSDCAAATQGSDDFGFNVSANVMPSCQVTATTLNFGAVDGIVSSTNIDADSTISITCSNKTAYKVMLRPSNDNSTGAGNMKGQITGNNDVVPYRLYRNPGRTTVWGNIADTNNAIGTGTGTAQQLTVYGRVPGVPNVRPDSYRDTVTVRVTY